MEVEVVEEAVADAVDGAVRGDVVTGREDRGEGAGVDVWWRGKGGAWEDSVDFVGFGEGGFAGFGHFDVVDTVGEVFGDLDGLEEGCGVGQGEEEFGEHC